MNWLETTGAAVGLLYIWLEYRASIYVWGTGIIMPAIYTVVYYEAGLYADCAINVYYIAAAVYGVAVWMHAAPKTLEQGQGGIVRTPAAMWPWLAAAFAVLWGVMGWALCAFTDSTVPWYDAFTTALSIVAMYMLAHKHAEQWLAWIVVDAVCCGLYLYKDLYATSALYGLYAVIAVLGYRQWCRMAGDATTMTTAINHLFDAVIVAAGDFPTHPVPAALLDHPCTVCCDGAANAFVASHRTPVAVVGDGDSLGEDTKLQVPFVHIDEQEHNDLTKAVCHVRSLAPCADAAGRPPRLAILGATGKREDHTLGNISLLVEYMRTGLDVQMVTDHGVFVPCHGTRTFTAGDQWWLPQLGRHGILRQEVSVFNFTCTRMQGRGLDFPLRPFSNWWQGTLNYVNSDTDFGIDADGDYLIFLSFSFRADR